MKILQAFWLQHPQHVRKLSARDLKRKVPRRKVLGLEHVARVREFRRSDRVGAHSEDV